MCLVYIGLALHLHFRAIIIVYRILNSKQHRNHISFLIEAANPLTEHTNMVVLEEVLAMNFFETT